MKLNPVEQKIYDVIREDIQNSNKDYSSITNNEISKKLNISVFSIRDKVSKLVEKKALLRRTDFWDNDMNYHQRIIYLNGVK